MHVNYMYNVMYYISESMFIKYEFISQLFENSCKLIIHRILIITQN